MIYQELPLPSVMTNKDYESGEMALRNTKGLIFVEDLAASDYEGLKREVELNYCGGIEAIERAEQAAEIFNYIKFNIDAEKVKPANNDDYDGSKILKSVLETLCVEELEIIDNAFKEFLKTHKGYQTGWRSASTNERVHQVADMLYFTFEKNYNECKKVFFNVLFSKTKNQHDNSFKSKKTKYI